MISAEVVGLILAPRRLILLRSSQPESGNRRFDLVHGAELEQIHRLARQVAEKSI